MMPLSFTLDNPGWMLLTAAVVPLGVVAWRGFVAMSPWRRAVTILLRAALLALAGLMLAGAASVRSTDRVAVIVVVDVSESAVRAGAFGDDGRGTPRGPAAFARDTLAALFAARGRDDLVGAVAFDGVATGVALPQTVDVSARPITGGGVEGSALADALDRAAAMFPPGVLRRVLLLSDGNQTSGDALAAAQRLAQRDGGTRVDVLPYRFRSGEEVVVEGLDAPGSAPPRSRVLLRVALNATSATTGTLRITREGEPLDINGAAAGTGRRIEVPAGRSVQLVEVEIGEQRLSRFAAVFEPDPGLGGDSVSANNRAEALTLVPGGGRVLLVDGVSLAAPGGAGTRLATVLEAAGITVDVRAPALAPRDVLELDGYDLVILANIAADVVDERFEAALQAYVRDLGGGLMLTGGTSAFAAGGWRGSSIEPILPVLLDLPEKLVVPDAAIVFVLDNSGSMSAPVLGSSRTQQSVANESAARAVSSLDKRDMIGVIAFNSVPEVIAPLAENTQPRRTADAIRGIASGGGTDIGPAVRLARDQLLKVDAKVKHVIVLTDGQSMEPESLAPLAGALREDGIRVSTIGVGDQSDNETLAAMAREGGGEFYSVINPNVLPKVFLKAVQIVRSPLIREVRFTPRLLPTGSPLTLGTTAVPDLGGLVLTQPRTDAAVTNAIVSPEGEPVLAHWRVGLGQVAAFTSEYHDWGGTWAEWPGERGFWAQVTRSLMRATSDQSGELRTWAESGGLRLRYEAFDDEQNPIERASVPVTVYLPDGGTTAINLRQTAPGIYEGVAAAPITGSYIAIATPRVDQSALRPVIAGTAISTGLEHQRLEPDVALLHQIATETGGQLIDPAAGVSPERFFTREGVEPRLARTPLWPVLLGWFLALSLVDIASRRVAWDRLIPDRGLERSMPATALRVPRPLRRASVAETGAPLSSRDAEGIERAARQRRAQAERERLDALRRSAPGPSAATAAAPPPESGGLLAAKRRARERFDEEGSGENAPPPPSV